MKTLVLLQTDNFSLDQYLIDNEEELKIREEVKAKKEKALEELTPKPAKKPGEAKPVPTGPEQPKEKTFYEKYGKFNNKRNREANMMSPDKEEFAELLADFHKTYGKWMLNHIDPPYTADNILVFYNH